MNCAECRENLVACEEGLLDREESLQCQAHLDACAACRAECAAIARMQQRLVASGQATAEVSLVEPVMRRVRAIQIEPKRNTIMSKLLTRWGFGLGAAAGAAAIILLALLAFPRAQATAAEVMTKGAQAVAKLTSIHLRAQLRTLPADNFSNIDPNGEFHAIELWKQFAPELKWRIEKPGRVAVMDGQSTLMFIKTANLATKLPQPSLSAFDTEWLHQIANLSTTISNELNNALAKGWKLSVAEETAPNGSVKAVVTIHAKSGLPDNDYVKNKFFEDADTRRVYRFDAQSELLEAVQVYLMRPSGEVLIFDLSQIDYDQPVDPSIWQLELPADVSWYQKPQKLPDNEKYASMTAEQAARAFFEACAREDWDEVEKFKSPVSAGLKEFLGGLEIVSLGESFTSEAYGGRYVPYEVKLRPQEINVRVSNANSAKRYVITGMADSRLQLQEEMKWSNEPEVLAPNDADAKLSPAEAVKAYVEAWSRLDWVEMRKFVPDHEVEQTKRQLEEAGKNGIDTRKLIPVMEAGEAFWSAEQSAFIVKCRMHAVKMNNVALRKDNPAGRWQVDGGI